MKLTEKKTSAGTIYFENATGEVVKKQCTSCREVKPLDEFSAHNIGVAGRSYWCRDCARKRGKQYNATPHGKAKQFIYNQKTRIQAVKDKTGAAIPNKLHVAHAQVEYGTDECRYCGKALEAHEVVLDHPLTYSRGGINDYSNILACCKPCNDRKGNKPLYSFLQEIDSYYARKVLFTLAQRQLKDVPTLLKELEAEAVSNRC